MCPPYLIDQCQNMYNSQVMIRFVPPQISLSTCYLPTRVCGDLCVRQFLRAAPSRGGLQCTFSCLFLGRFGIMIPKLLLLLYTSLIPPPSFYNLFAELGSQQFLHVATSDNATRYKSGCDTLKFRKLFIS